jgi:8-oxo-dGTP diphosphatase
VTARRPAARAGAGESTDRDAGFLAAYDPTAYPPVAVTVDLVVLTLRQGRLSVLLVERASPPFKGTWALPGGFIGPDENSDAAAIRELGEETGLDARDWHVEQLRTYTCPARDPRMRVVSIAYLAVLPDAPVPTAGSDAAAARFWPVDDVVSRGGPRLGFDHADILRDGVERAKAKLEYTTLAATFLEEPFTLLELRRVYETVWAAPLEPSNFRRKVLGADGFLDPTGDKSAAVTTGGKGRPKAELFVRGPASHLSPPFMRPPGSPA